MTKVTVTKETWGGERLLSVCFHIAEASKIRTGAGAGQGPGGKTWSRGRGEGPTYWLALHGLVNLLSYSTQDHLPWDGTTLKELGGPSHVNYKSRSTPTTGLPTGQSGRGIFLVEVPSSKRTLVCVKLTEKLANTYTNKMGALFIFA